MVPCAQGRVVIETQRPAPPYFATCTSYRRAIVNASSEISTATCGTSSSSTVQIDQRSIVSNGSKGAISKNILSTSRSIVVRPDDLGVTPWYLDVYQTIDSSPGPSGDRSSYPSDSNVETKGKLDVTLFTGNNSTDDELPRSLSVTGVPRKAYMDLRDAMALLDETCPNREPSPFLTPRTPRTPLTPHPRNKRARSKSSDNSSNYSNERLSDRSFEKEGKEKKRPFLKKIGISKTEDKPFLAKLAPKIIGKPYLEKIGPSKAVERPYLQKIGSSKTLDQFSFDTVRGERRIVRSETAREDTVQDIPEENKFDEQKVPRTLKLGQSFTADRRRSGKGTLLKMYSFETEDLEVTIQAKEHRDQLRGVSLNDVLDSGPSSLPLESTSTTTTTNTTIITTTTEEPEISEVSDQSKNGAELVRCRVTTSEELVSTNTSFGSDKEPSSWGSSPRRKWQLKKDGTIPRTPTHTKFTQSDDSVPSSPTKRPISSVATSQDSEKNIYSPLKTRRQTYEDLLDRNGKGEENKVAKQAQFEIRGISSDNLLTKNRTMTVEYRGRDQIDRTRETTSEHSLAQRAGQGYSRETFKQLQDKFKHREMPTETYADFKRRTRGSTPSIIGRQQEGARSNNIIPDDKDERTKTTFVNVEAEEKVDRNNERTKVRGGTVRSVLKKQQGIDQASDQELDTNASVRRPKRRIFHEPSQETMDLLTELRKVKSLLKTPSWEEDLELDKKPARQPKRILLTDKEFCLSVERENSIRRSSKAISSLEKTEDSESNKKKEDSDKSIEKTSGPALFEKKCLSLDYADDEKPQKPEARTISLASAKNLPLESEGTVDYSDLILICDTKSYSSDVFNTPSGELGEKERGNDLNLKDFSNKTGSNHYAEVDVAIPIDQKTTSSECRVQIHETSDLYEIISPGSTPFRVNKRLGKISVEETVKPESFTLGSKVDCRLSAVTQKRTKCFPL